MQHTICRRRRSNGRQPWWTSRPHQQSHRQCNSIWKGSQHRKEQGHDRTELNSARQSTTPTQVFIKVQIDDYWYWTPVHELHLSCIACFTPGLQREKDTVIILDHKSDRKKRGSLWHGDNISLRMLVIDLETWNSSAIWRAPLFPYFVRMVATDALCWITAWNVHAAIDNRWWTSIKSESSSTFGCVQLNKHLHCVSQNR